MKPESGAAGDDLCYRIVCRVVWDSASRRRGAALVSRGDVKWLILSRWVSLAMTVQSEGIPNAELPGFDICFQSFVCGV